MTTSQSRFKTWFIESMIPLRHNGDAGFIFALTAFPLLERYLRRKCGCSEGQNLNNAFFDELGLMFHINGSEFWSCYRNGLLHQVAFATGKYRKKQRIWLALPLSGFSGHDPRPVYFDPSLDRFFLNPVAFYDAVVGVILSDFSTYESGLTSTSYFSLPSVSAVHDTSGLHFTDGTGSCRASGRQNAITFPSSASSP